MSSEGGRYFVFFTSIFVIFSNVVFSMRCFEHGQCLDSLILNITTLENPKACLHHCQKVKGCEWFTHYSETNLCMSLSVCLTLEDKRCKDCVSGEKECQDYVCGIKGRCLGSMQGVRYLQDRIKCHSECSSTNHCHWYTFDKTSKACLMTADCARLDMTCDNCFAWELGCKALDPTLIASGTTKKSVEETYPPYVPEAAHTLPPPTTTAAPPVPTTAAVSATTTVTYQTSY